MPYTAALCVAGSIPAWSKYLYDLHLVVSGLAVRVSEIKCVLKKIGLLVFYSELTPAHYTQKRNDIWPMILN